MLNLPTEIMVLMQHFAPVFNERTWDWVPVLMVGAILAPGKRTLVSRLRQDAALYDFPGEQPAGKRGPKPKKGARQPSLKTRLHDPATVWKTITITWYHGQTRTLEIATGTALWYTRGQNPLPLRWILVRDPLGKLKSEAFFATDLTADAVQILAWCIMRWGIEVTFEEARAHLGIETQRQWSDLVILRTTPALLGLFSFIVLLAHQLIGDQPLPVRSDAWYTKSEATFSDVVAFVRRYLWTHTKFEQAPSQTRPVPISTAVLHGLVDLLCYAA